MKTKMANKWILPATLAVVLAFGNSAYAQLRGQETTAEAANTPSAADSIPASATPFSVQQTCTAPPAVPPPTSAFSGGQPVEAYQSIYHSFWEFIKDSYYGPSKLDNWGAMEHAFDDKLATPADLHIALKELAKATNDKWTSYTTPLEIREYRQREAQGIISAGVELYKNDGQRYQVDVITYQSPAWQTALRERDYVRCVNGVEIATLTKEQVDALVRGTNGARVKITAAAAEDGREYTVELTIAPTPKAAVEAIRFANGEIYVRMPSFDGPSYNVEFLKAFTREYKGEPVRGIILDLRNNKGGEMPEAIKFDSLFLPDGAVVTKSMWRDANGFHSQDKLVIPAAELKIGGQPVDATVLNILKTARLRILVNGSTASAAEVAFGGLKDNKRGTSYGVTTFGKGTGWIGMEGPARGTITITGLRFQTPLGHEVHKVGIAPDVEVHNTRTPTQATGVDQQMEEALEYMPPR